MKNHFDSWRKFVIKEGLSDVLWHHTQLYRLAAALKDNRFLTSGAFTKPDSESEHTKGKMYYMSTTRTPSISYGAFSSRHPYGAVLQLDGRKLGQRFKGVPVDYFATSDFGSSKKSAKMGKTFYSPTDDDVFEAEDRIITDKPFIDDADKYITAVHIALPLYDTRTTDWKTGKFELVKKSQLRFADYHYGRKVAEMLEDKGIPFYIHINPKTWMTLGVSQDKALTSWKQFEQALSESETELEKIPKGESFREITDSPGYGTDDLRMFTLAAEAILKGEEKMPEELITGDSEDGYTNERNRRRKAKQFFHQLAKQPTAAVEDIKNALHNSSSKPASRDALESLASLMRSIGKKDIYSFADYLMKVYKENHPEGETYY